MLIFGFKYRLGKSTIHLNLNLTGVQTHNLQIIDSTFYVPETLVWTISEPFHTFPQKNPLELLIWPSAGTNTISLFLSDVMICNSREEECLPLHWMSLLRPSVVK